MPEPTMFRASTRVLAWSITWSLNCRKFRQPLPPASTTVVTPLRKVKPSGGTLLVPLLR